MNSSTITITPELAREYLAKNIDKNRPIRKAVVHAYAEQMKRGEWKITPQGISFDQKGRLIDGQHRLMAVIESGAKVPMYVTTGVPVDRMLMIDCGTKRTAADILSIANPKLGKLYNKQTCAIAVDLMRQFSIAHKPSATQIGEYIKGRPGFFMLCNQIRGRTVNFNSSSPCIIGCAAAYVNGEPMEQIEDFMHTVGYNEIGEKPYNYRAALDYKDFLLKSREGLRYRASNLRANFNDEKRVATEVAILKFISNRKTYKGEDEPYPITDKMLTEFIWK